MTSRFFLRALRILYGLELRSAPAFSGVREGFHEGADLCGRVGRVAEFADHGDDRAADYHPVAVACDFAGLGGRGDTKAHGHGRVGLGFYLRHHPLYGTLDVFALARGVGGLRIRKDRQAIGRRSIAYFEAEETG